MKHACNSTYARGLDIVEPAFLGFGSMALGLLVDFLHLFS